MRKNNKTALRVLSTATFLAMVASCTVPAFAGTYYLENGDITVDAKEDGNHITQGDLYQDHLDEGKTIITDHEDESDTSAVSNTVTINVDDNATGDVTIKDANIDNSSASEYTAKSGITVDAKGESSKANITLDNVTVKPGEDGDGGNNNGGAGLEVKGNGTANIELNGDNTLNGGICHAGVEKDDKKGTGNLIIKDDYNDDDSTKTGTEADTTGSLTANGGSDGAGIGGGEYDDTSNIEISGGKVTAIGGHDAAGIGGGRLGNADYIKISGGDITAIGSFSSAGIGDGYNDHDDKTGTCHIEITGGTIHAISDDGAAIGSAEQGRKAEITLSGGNITAESGYGAGIGSGYNAYVGSTVKISGKDTLINATSKSGAGIGSGYCDDSDSQYTITINDGTVNATGSTGIGIADDGMNSTSANITINGGKITATGTSHSAGIGNGWDSSSDEEAVTNITITGGDITAVGGKGAAGIGDGASNYDNTVNVIITGGTIKAVGGEGAAAIGGGVHEDADEDTTKTTVKIDSSNRALKITAIVQGNGEGAIGNGTLEDDDPFSGVDFDDITVDSLGEEHGALVQFMNNYDAETGTGTLYKAIHNKKYIEETYNNPNDDHEWGNPKIIKEAAPGVPGIIRYTCVVDGCGATHDVPYDYKAPEEPGNTPTTPDVKPGTPAAPDAPVQDVTPADGTVLPGNVQSPDVLDAKPEDAPVTPANAVNPAVQNAKSLPQTGANWLAVLGTALSGAFLMAAGFFLDRKRGENR